MNEILENMINYFSLLREKEEELSFSYERERNVLTKQKSILKIFSRKRYQEIQNLTNKIKKSEAEQFHFTSIFLTLDSIRNLFIGMEKELLSSSNDIYLSKKDYMNIKNFFLKYQKTMQEIEATSKILPVLKDIEFCNLLKNWISNFFEIINCFRKTYQNYFNTPEVFTNVPIDVSILFMSKKELWRFAVFRGYEYEIYNQLCYFLEYLKKEGYIIPYACLEDASRKRK